jgi:peptidoglycan/xylan/chitin deacetylase (PgdA/CDA1 family)
MHKFPKILTYHSQNVGHGPAAVNDHIALARDLDAMHLEGFRFAPVSAVLDWFASAEPDRGLEKTVCITFDDGCDLDFDDIDWPGLGLQRSMLGIMRDFVDRHGASAQPGLHATSFVIASPEARTLIDRGSLFGRGWISDHWWADAVATGLLSIGNHGWDHNHPDLAGEGAPRGGFSTVDDRAQCEQQVVQAARFIEGVAGVHPDVFAYPFGESSAYIREAFFPELTELHRCRAAFGTDPAPVTPGSDRWNLPRYVCGRDWRSSTELLALLHAG